MEIYHHRLEDQFDHVELCCQHSLKLLRSPFVYEYLELRHQQTLPGAGHYTNIDGKLRNRMDAILYIEDKSLAIRR